MGEYKEVNAKVFLTEENMQLVEEIIKIKKQEGYENYKVEDVVSDILLVGFNERFNENAKLLVQVGCWHKSK